MEFYPVTLDQTLYGPLEGKLDQEMHTQRGHLQGGTVLYEDSTDGARGGGFLWCFTLELRQYW